MKGLFLLLLIISAEAMAAGPNCARLQTIAFDYELRMKRKIITPSCREETLPEITVTDITLKDEVLERMRCSPLNVLEERAKTLENQVTLIGGFQILKSEIRENKEAAAQENLTRAQRSARDFKRALGTAQAFDLLLNTVGAQPIIRELKAIPEENRNSPAKLLQTMRGLCSNRQGRDRNAQDACSNQFSPDEDSVRELNSLISQAALTDSELTTMSGALAIEKQGGGSWSFREMYAELREAVPKIRDGRLTLTRTELNAIKNIPDFQDVASLPFINALKTAKNGMKTHTSLEKFKFVADDLKERMKVESRSKIGWLWKEVKDSGITLSPEQRAVCDQSLRDFEKAKACWTSVAAAKETIPTLNADKKAFITNLENGMGSSLRYLDNFEEVSRCLSPQEGQTALVTANTGDELTNCSSLNMLNADLAKIQNELLVINGLRDRIATQNQRDMQFRNFAIEKLATMNCASRESSVVECEDFPVDTVAPVAMNLISDVVGLSIIHSSPATPTDMEATCEESTGAMEEDLCSFYDSPPANPNVTDRPAPPTGDSAYVEVRDARDPSREAFTEGLRNIGWGIVGQLQQRPPMYPNPYASINPFPYNYNPYLGNGALSPSDQILFNARFYGGYGYYTPTLGAAPYTAFPVVSPYVQAGAGNSSSYFANFGTYK
ncbi:MAG: hypothetical protein V4598_07310 [Bdellovibrionota bacterium]